MVGRKAQVDAAQRRQGPDHQAGPDDEHDGQRHFDDHERASKPLPSAAHRRLLRPLPERVDEIQAQRSQGGQDAEQYGREDAESQREGDDRPVEADRRERRKARRVERDERAQRGRRHHQAEGRATERQHHALGDQLPDQPGGSRADRRPQGQFAQPRVAADEQQVRDVRAGDQQQERDGSHQDPQRRTHPATNLLVDGHGERAEPHRLGIKALLGPSPRQRAQLLGRRRRGLARRQHRRRRRTRDSPARGAAMSN